MAARYLFSSLEDGMEALTDKVALLEFHQGDVGNFMLDGLSCGHWSGCFEFPLLPVAAFVS